MDLFSEIAFKTSKVITQNYSTSFSGAVSLLEKEKQDAIYSIYGFVRFADEIVDTFHQCNQSYFLDKFEADLNEAIVDGLSLNPVLHAFSLTIRKYNIDKKYVDAFLASMRADLKKQIYNNYEELSEYIHGSADVVGLMCLKVFVDGDEKLFDQLQLHAIKLGSAFQKVNFLRDLKSDTEGLHRIYFPQLGNNEFTEPVKNEIITDIEKDFAEARKGIDKLPGRSKLAVLMAFTYYTTLLSKLKETPAVKISESRIRVPDWYKYFLFTKIRTQYKLSIL